MKPRTILDCRRDVKGLHEWQEVATVCHPRDPDEYIFWCWQCGAIGEASRSMWRRGPVKSSEIKVTRRVQELIAPKGRPA